MKNHKCLFIVLAALCFPAVADDFEISKEGLIGVFDSIGRLPTGAQIDEMIMDGGTGVSSIFEMINASGDILMVAK